MMRPEDIRPGAVFEWPHSFSVWSRWTIDRLEYGYAWVHHAESGTINRLSVEAIRMHARLVEDAIPLDEEEEDISESEMWLIYTFMIVVALVLVIYLGHR